MWHGSNFIYCASIDGFIADKAGGVAWLEENIRGDEEDRSYDEMYEK